MSINTTKRIVTGNNTATGALGSEPLSPTVGDLYLPNNSPSLEQRGATAWVPWGPIYPLTAPVDADFAWINQGSASVTATTSSIYLRAPVSSGDSVRLRKKTAPSTPYTITAGFLAPLVGLLGSGQYAGLSFRQSSDGKLANFYVGNDSSGFHIMESAKFSSPTAFSASYARRGYAYGSVVWLRITDDGVSRICSFSGDSQNWQVLHSVGRTDYMTANEVGFFINEITNTTEAAMTLISWKQA